ncbi:hypothetical protein Cgig2_003573 [Carnegiea gigantea]|uniref:Uncharacterized protein n=1 Tax=Carnegiea gigantea TaxID=171969 RepID=A0A9Q1Q8V4_9CARY|nr:hypothetical protein Cgig2_003573 [Carnegiea gigantea]
MMRCTGMSAKQLSLAQARSTFRNGQSVSFRASAFLEQSPNGWDLVDMKLSDEDFKFFTIYNVLFSLRQQRNMMDLAQVVAILYRCDTCAKFYIPNVEEAFNTAEIVTKMEGLDSTYTSEIAHMEDNLKELSNKALALEVREKESLKEEEHIRFAKLQDLEKEKNQLNNLVDSIISFNKY